MNDTDDIKSGAENPEALTGLRHGTIKKTVAGIPGILSGLSYVVKEAGVVRGWRALAQLNQKGGFDCPSCAWPDPDDDRSRLGEYCENGARAVADEATSKKLTPSFFAENSVQALGSLSDYEIGKKGRIAQPMYLPKGATHYQPISWEGAFQKIASSLKALPSPDQAIFYTSGRTSNEAAFLYQLFVRAYGTNNLPDCSNLCHESSGVALTESLGIGKGSVKLSDFEEAEVILILGQNPGTNHPRMLTALQKAKTKGAFIISINPLPEAGLVGFSNPQQVGGLLNISTTLTDIFLPVRINGDMALLQAIELLLLQEEVRHPGSVCDLSFIEKNTQGWPAFQHHLQQQNLDELLRTAGINFDLLEATVNAIKHKKRIIACWAMGLTQHKDAVNTIKEIVNLLLMKGSIGKPGAGTCPVRGHSNVQGDRTMGIYEKPSAAFLKSIENTFHFSPPLSHGYDVVDAIKAMHSGKATVFFAMGGNFLSATPDTNYTAEALRNCELTVQVSTKLNRSHLVHGKEAFILPCLGRTDRDTTGGTTQFVSCENSMGVVQSSKGILQPVSEDLLSEPAIVCRLAKAALGDTTAIPWDNYLEHYDNIRADIERVVPGFESYNERVRTPGGFYLPNVNRDGIFATPSAKAQFNIAVFKSVPLHEDELMMTTVRSHDQFNTTVYGLNDRYRGIYNERRVILMNVLDMELRSITSGDLVDIYNQEGGIERVAHKFVALSYPIPKDCTAMYFPEANVLVPISSVAEKSNTPSSKMVVIKVRKSRSEASC